MVMEKKVCAHTIISGRVQGVFFRMETKSAADRLQINGWVKNRADGTVEAMFEGEQKKIESILRWCREEGTPLSDVEKVTVSWEDYSGRFEGFKITH
jgi:acylphosphatase